MEDKKTIAERLREIENMDGCDVMRVVRASGWEKPPCVSSGDTCTECSTKILLRLADAIETELNTSKSRELPEDIEWPRFEDGELVKFGDEFLNTKGNTATVTRIALSEKHFTINKGQGRICKTYGNRIKRPEPEVLDADGVPVKVGDTVWFPREKEPLFVNRIHPSGQLDLTYELGGWGGFGFVLPSEVTHRKPDTQEAIDDDATVPAAVYCVRHGLVESDTDVDDATLLELHILDLLARQRKLLGGEQ